jgi:hypothetical protein
MLFHHQVCHEHTPRPQRMNMRPHPSPLPQGEGIMEQQKYRMGGVKRYPSYDGVRATGIGAQRLNPSHTPLPSLNPKGQGIRSPLSLGEGNRGRFSGTGPQERCRVGGAKRYPPSGIGLCGGYRRTAPQPTLQEIERIFSQLQSLKGGRNLNKSFVGVWSAAKPMDSWLISTQSLRGEDAE